MTFEIFLIISAKTLSIGKIQISGGGSKGEGGQETLNQAVEAWQFQTGSRLAAMLGVGLSHAHGAGSCPVDHLSNPAAQEGGTIGLLEDGCAALEHLCKGAGLRAVPGSKYYRDA